jgi:hypothetical protein
MAVAAPTTFHGYLSAQDVGLPDLIAVESTSSPAIKAYLRSPVGRSARRAPQVVVHRMHKSSTGWAIVKDCPQ